MRGKTRKRSKGRASSHHDVQQKMQVASSNDSATSPCFKQCSIQEKKYFFLFYKNVRKKFGFYFSPSFFRCDGILLREVTSSKNKEIHKIEMWNSTYVNYIRQLNQCLQVKTWVFTKRRRLEGGADCKHLYTLFIFLANLLRQL